MSKSETKDLLFPAWLMERARWRTEAEALTPRLHRAEVQPERVVVLTPQDDAFQGWAVGDAPDPDPTALKHRVMNKGDSFTLDFGRHQVGYLKFALESDQSFNDAPVRLRLVLGEVPAEVAEPFDSYSGWLSRAWLQDVQIDVDELPALVRLPRRYAFRFLRVEVVDASGQFSVKVTDISCETVTSAGPDLGQPPADPVAQAIDTVGLHTLRQCMQTVFEDGPKRDRRLWLGDLRLQALANSVSFQDYNLVKRCLLLHAGLARSEDGVVSACIFERPLPSLGNAFILDYTALFGPTLLEYVQASGDVTLGEDLWPVARHQMDYCLSFVEEETGLFRDPGGQWLFLDWHPELHKETGLHAVLIYAARRTAQLARRIGLPAEAERLESVVERMVSAARERLRDAGTGLYTSGPDRQVSWASQAWMVLAGVPEGPEECGGLFDALEASREAIRPAGPYLWHYVVDALFTCGRRAQALSLLRSYWGGMITHGATTFWEVYDPSDERLSPYGSALINSYCHAWSCTPTYFLRTHAA